MAFNSNTYQANKAAKLAWKALSDARALRARIRIGDAYDWEQEIMLPRLVRTACDSMKRAVFFRSLNA